MFVVYQARNKRNGKRYIGVTSKGLRLRKSAHLRIALRNGRGCPRFYAAIRKYGADSFEWSVLASFAIREFAYHHEFILVRDLKPEYNAVAGGNLAYQGAPSPWRRPVICLESGMVYPSIENAATSLNAAEVVGCCHGKRITSNGLHFQFFAGPMTDSERIKAISLIDEAGVKRRQRVLQPITPAIALLRNRPGIPVICLDTGEIFPSTVAAARSAGTDAGSINRVCLFSRRIKSAKGRHYAYIKDVGQRMFA